MTRSSNVDKSLQNQQDENDVVTNNIIESVAHKIATKKKAYWSNMLVSWQDLYESAIFKLKIMLVVDEKLDSKSLENRLNEYVSGKKDLDKDYSKFMGDEISDFNAFIQKQADIQNSADSQNIVLPKTNKQIKYEALLVVLQGVSALQSRANVGISGVSNKVSNHQLSDTYLDSLNVGPRPWDRVLLQENVGSNSTKINLRYDYSVLLELIRTNSFNETSFRNVVNHLDFKINHQDDLGRTILFEWVFTTNENEHQAEKLDILIEAGLDLNVVDSDGFTAAEQVIRNGDITPYFEKLKLLHERGATFDNVDYIFSSLSKDIQDWWYQIKGSPLDKTQDPLVKQAYKSLAEPVMATRDKESKNPTVVHYRYDADDASKILNSDERVVVEKAMRAIEKYVDVKFETGAVDENNKIKGIRIYKAYSLGSGVYGTFGGGDIAFLSSITNGSIFPQVILHELGHALGLSHPKILDPVKLENLRKINPNPTQVEYQDQDSNFDSTVMSYFEGKKACSDEIKGLQWKDIAALQLLYGVPADNYPVKIILDGVRQVATYYNVSELDASAYGLDSILHLDEGLVSIAGEQRIWLAPGSGAVVAKASKAGSIIYDNKENNILFAGAGSDQFVFENYAIEDVDIIEQFNPITDRVVFGDSFSNKGGNTKLATLFPNAKILGTKAINGVKVFNIAVVPTPDGNSCSMLIPTESGIKNITLKGISANNITQDIFDESVRGSWLVNKNFCGKDGDMSKYIIAAISAIAVAVIGIVAKAIYDKKECFGSARVGVQEAVNNDDEEAQIIVAPENQTQNQTSEDEVILDEVVPFIGPSVSPNPKPKMAWVTEVVEQKER